jgi:hypothetical protein
MLRHPQPLGFLARRRLPAAAECPAVIISFRYRGQRNQSAAIGTMKNTVRTQTIGRTNAHRSRTVRGLSDPGAVFIKATAYRLLI